MNGFAICERLDRARAAVGLAEPEMPSSVSSSMIVRVVPVSMPMLQRQGASAGTVTGVARRSTILTVTSS